jgi:hypothetical protein
VVKSTPKTSGLLDRRGFGIEPFKAAVFSRAEKAKCALMMGLL